MTPKEKAKDLYLKYKKALNITDMRIESNPFCKQCALIAVDEILKAIGISMTDEYWQQVKEEIEKL